MEHTKKRKRLPNGQGMPIVSASVPYAVYAGIRNYSNALSIKQRKFVSVGAIIRAMLTDAGFADDGLVERFNRGEPTPGATTLAASDEAVYKAGFEKAVYETFCLIGDTVTHKGCQPRAWLSAAAGHSAMVVDAAIKQAVSEGYVIVQGTMLHRPAGECECVDGPKPEGIIPEAEADALMDGLLNAAKASNVSPVDKVVTLDGAVDVKKPSDSDWG